MARKHKLAKLLSFLLLGLLVGAASAQSIVLTPSQPQYGFQVFAGSTRQIHAQIAKTRTVTDGAMTATSAVLTSATASFAIGDVGTSVLVTGAGGGGGTLSTTVATFTNSTTVTLSVAASTTVSGASTTIGAIPCGPATIPSCTGTANWTVAATTGGASATFTDPTHTAVSSIAGGLATMQINIGATAGTCAIAGSIGSYTITSPATVTIGVQSTDDVTQTGTFTFDVCNPPTCTANALANGQPCVIVMPAYQQAYQTQKMTLQSYIPGYTDETGTWSILSQPGGGDGALADTGNRDTVFSATVTGRYTLKYTSHANASISGSAIVYVVPAALPSYVSTPNQTQPRACFVDPANTGPDIEIGAGKAYTTIAATPDLTMVAPGTTYRLWNTDLTGVSPSTFFEYYQIDKFGTATQPITFCGVPDSLGNEPVMDANNATGPANASNFAAGLGVISVLNNSPFAFWQDGSPGPNYISITGIHFKNANSLFNYVPPGGSGPCINGGSGTICSWSSGAACVSIRNGSFIDVSGNDIDTCGNGVFSSGNANSGWGGITQEVSIIGSHTHGSGTAGQPGDHQNYLQNFYLLYEGNRVDNYLCTAQGADLKFRGVEGVIRYNLLGFTNGCDGPTRNFDGVDAEDGTPYLDLTAYLSAGPMGPGYPNCAYSPYCGGDTAGVAVIAAYQESFQKDFLYGNIAQGVAGGQIHYNGDSGSGLAERQGVLYYFNNTMPNAGLVFDTENNGDNPTVMDARVDVRNNIIWQPTPNTLGAYSILAMNRSATQIQLNTTNLYATNSIFITPPVNGGVVTSTQAGWGQGGCYGSGCPWPLTTPLNPHMYGMTSPNFLTTTTQPYANTTYIPPSGSAAIGAGTALSGVLATMPVRWNYNTTLSALTPRLYPLDIGAEDHGAVTNTLTIRANISGVLVK